MPANEIDGPTAPPHGATGSTEPSGSPASDRSTPPTLAETFVEQYEQASEDDDYSEVDFYIGDDDWFDPDGVTADVIASISWSADYGMPAGNGWSSLVEFPDGSAVSLRGGDDATELKAEKLPPDEPDRAQAIVSWCDVFGPLAALALEPLDPAKSLSDEARSQWEAAMSNASSSIVFGLDEASTQQVRAAFAETDEVYARAKAALAAPTTEEGGLLLDAIRSLEVGPNEYCLGDWEVQDA